MYDIPPLNSITTTQRLIGQGHSKVYELIAEGALEARKAGSKTLVTGESIQRYIATLPPAPVRGRRSAAGSEA